MKKEIVPFRLKDAPALIEHLLPVQKLSAEVFRERKAGAGQTLVPLGAYWKGRKPLILNKACLLGALLPATDSPTRDLEIFELLLGMDDFSITKRLSANKINNVRQLSYRDLVTKAKRPEEVANGLHDHIWEQVNLHLGTSAGSFPELVEQLGVMRFGRVPNVADSFSGSGQIPFEAARLGCEVSASDLNPMACMLSWGAFKLFGRSAEERTALENELNAIAKNVLLKIDELGVETDGNGWRAKSYLYCIETRCPQSGWLVPLLPTRVLSFSKRAIVELIPNEKSKSYELNVVNGASEFQMQNALLGTLRSEGRRQEPYMVHTVDSQELRSKISTIRGDYRKSDGSFGNRLRQWEVDEFMPRPDDIFQERLYAVHWMRPKGISKKMEYEFRGVSAADLKRETLVHNYIAAHLKEWQMSGILPDTRIEQGDKTDEPIRTRGWTYWHHLFPPRHLLTLGLIRQHAKSGESVLLFARILDYASKLCQWTTSKAGSSKPGEGGRTGGASDNPAHVFYNQALNTFYNYGCRASAPLLQLFLSKLPEVQKIHNATINCQPAAEFSIEFDVGITDPPYGDAVKYEEILEYFIAWIRKSPPIEFSKWTWDSRRALAIRGEGEEFRGGMIAAYSKLSTLMTANAIQIVMFTHQSGAIWADMANIVWASGLCVTAAWYVVTETDSALKDGSHVKGTVLLVLRKRNGILRTTRDDLAWEIKEEVERQVSELTGLNQTVRLNRDENVFEDADLQMAGYAAALRIITRYSVIDGRDMPAEARRPRVSAEPTFVDSLIEFAVEIANRTLVPSGIAKSIWDKLSPAERFYLKMIELEARGSRTLDNYQNFAKAFKVRNYQAMMAKKRANNARLMGAKELGRLEMSEGSEFYLSPLRATLYALMELANDVDADAVVQHLSFNVKDYLTSAQPREMVVALADYLGSKLEGIRPEEASAARVLRELVRNQRLG